MADKTRETKRKALQRQGTLNLRSNTVTHPLFQASDFFDSDDMIQVKYEMLRQVRVEQQPVTQSAKAFGFSRPSFYQAQLAFEQNGLSGLIPQKRGPHSAHKLTAEVMQFLNQARAIRYGGAPAQRRTATLTAKKTTVNSLSSEVCASNELIARYEELRRQALDPSSRMHRGPGLVLLIQRGTRAWMEVSSRCPTPSPTTLRPSNGHDVLASDQRGEIVMILAAMTLHQYREVNGSTTLTKKSPRRI